MRALLLAILFTSVAYANPIEIVRDDPPPPPKLVVVQPPPPPHPYVRPLLGDRWSMTPRLGVGWMQVDGTYGIGGALIQPNVTRTFDHFELSADYTVLDWSHEMRSSGTLHRVGGTVQYQLARVRFKNEMTFDFTGAAGLGYEHYSQEHGASIDRPDLAFGVVLRMLANVDSEPKRIFFGFEFDLRMLVAPRPGGGSDLGFVVAFGVPIGW